MRMKKLVVLFLGAILLFAAAPAFAADNPPADDKTVDLSQYFEFKGEFKTWYLFPDNVTHNYRGLMEWHDAKSYGMSRLELELTFKPNDVISFFWQGRANFRWDDDFSMYDDGSKEGSALVRQIYGQLAGKWGTFKVGRIDDVDSLGLASLGYSPSSSGEGYLFRRPFDGMDRKDTASYGYDWDSGFGLYAYYSNKVINRAEYSLNYDEWSSAPDSFDGETYYEFALEGRYRWESGGVSLAVSTNRDNSRSADMTLGTTTYRDLGRTSAWYINPAFVQNFGDFGFHAEAMFGWGKVRVPGQSLSYDTDQTGYALYADLTYDYGPGDVALLGWYASGTSWSDDEKHSFVGMGDFAPLLVAFYDTTLGYGEYSANAGWDSAGPGNGNGPNNNWGVALTGKHAVTNWLTLDWAVGYTALVVPNYRWANPVSGGLDYSGKALGWEADLGFTVQLLDNLSISGMFGYMFSGDAYDVVLGYDGNVPRWRSADDSYVLVGTLKFTF